MKSFAEAKPDDKAANTIIRNIEVWADGLNEPQKELLLLAIEKRSPFTFDMIYWIKHATELLLALSNAPACDTYYRDKLRKHALWLICTFSWIPDDEETTAFVENYRMTETLFGAAINAYKRNCLEFLGGGTRTALGVGLQGREVRNWLGNPGKIAIRDCNALTRNRNPRGS